MTGQERRVARAEFVSRLFAVVVSVLLTATMAALVLLALATAEQAETNGDIGERIRSCTTPTGECYKRNERRTGQAVADIGTYNTYLLACSQGMDSSGRGPQAIATELIECATKLASRR